MNVYFALNGITFVWDDEKAKNNPNKHDGITFQQAAEVFFDPFLVVVDASRNYVLTKLKSMNVSLMLNGITFKGALLSLVIEFVNFNRLEFDRRNP